MCKECGCVSKTTSTHWRYTWIYTSDCVTAGFIADANMSKNPPMKINLLYTIDTNYSNELIKWGEFQRIHKARTDNNKNDISIRLPLKIWHILWKYILTSSPSLFSPAFFHCFSDGHSSQISFDVWKFKTHKLSGWALHMKWICYEYLICITFHKNK